METQSLLRQLHSLFVLYTFDALPLANAAKQGEISRVNLIVIILYTLNSQKHFVFTVLNANNASKMVRYISKSIILVFRKSEFSRH